MRCWIAKWIYGSVFILSCLRQQERIREVIWGPSSPSREDLAPFEGSLQQALILQEFGSHIRHCLCHRFASFVLTVDLALELNTDISCEFWCERVQRSRNI